MVTGRGAVFVGSGRPLVECADLWLARGQRVVGVISDHPDVAAWCDRHGAPWTGGLAVKVTRLNRQKFWDDADRSRFEPDYAFLRDCLRTSVRAA